MEEIKKILNNPKTLITFLTILLLISIIIIYRLGTSSKIYISSLNDDDVSISTIHAFINNDMHMFYSTPASYKKDDFKVYEIEVGYYIKNGNKFTELLTQKDTFDTAESFSKVLEFYSSYNYIESNNRTKKFTNEVKSNFSKNLFFIIRVKKDKGGSLDTIYQKNIEMKKITK